MAINRWNNNGRVRYDFALDGTPFFSAANSEYPYIRQTSAFQKDQIDTAPTPGEQSLQGWWYRSQNSFDLGAGALYNDSLTDDKLSRRFYGSLGVDPFSIPGQVRTLPSMVGYVNPTGTDNISRKYLAIVPSGTFDAEGKEILWNVAADKDTWPTFPYYRTYIRVYAVNGTTPVVTLNLVGMPDWQLPVFDSTGQYVFVGFEVYTTASYLSGTGTPIATIPPVMSASDSDGKKRTISFVKERLVVTVGRRVTIFAPSPTGQALTDTDVFYTHGESDWEWVGAMSGPNKIYLVGPSAVYACGIEQQSNQLYPSIYTPSVVARVPDGETISSAISHLDTYVAIGTTRGVRIAVIDGNGGLVVGPISCETLDSVSALSAHGNFVYAAGFPRFALETATAKRQFLNANLLRIDLSKQIDSLLFPWVHDYSVGYDLSLTDTSDAADEIHPYWLQSSLNSTQLSRGSIKQIFLRQHTSISITGGSGVGTNRIGSLEKGSLETTETLPDVVILTSEMFPRGASADTILENRIFLATRYQPSGYDYARRAVPMAWLQTSRIRLDTLENKMYQHLTLNFDSAFSEGEGDYRTDGVQFGLNRSVVYYNSSENANFVQLDAFPWTTMGYINGYDTTLPYETLIPSVLSPTAIKSGAAGYEISASDLVPHTWVSYVFQFEENNKYEGINAGDYWGKRVPAFLGYQLKAQPAKVRQRTIRIPLLAANREEAMNGTIIERSVADRVRQLEIAEELGAVVLFQDLGTGEERECLIENIQYISDYIPQDRAARTEKPGMLLVTLRAIRATDTSA